jgi:hypothetical protein
VQGGFAFGFPIAKSRSSKALEEEDEPEEVVPFRHQQILQGLLPFPPCHAFIFLRRITFWWTDMVFSEAKQERCKHMMWRSCARTCAAHRGCVEDAAHAHVVVHFSSQRTTCLATVRQSSTRKREITDSELLSPSHRRDRVALGR